MKEKNFQITFNHWLKNVYKKTGAYELKQAKGDSLPFNAVVPHQIQALEQIRNGMFVYKIPDMGYQNPYDCYSLFQEPAYVVIKYDKFFCLIPINFFIQEAKISKRKSLTSTRAKEIATLVINS